MKRISRFAVSVLMLLTVTACANGVDGFLGVTWKTPADVAAERLGVHCGAWTYWPDMDVYQHCDDNVEKNFWGQTVTDVSLARNDRNGRLVGVALVISDCDFPALRHALMHEFSFSPADVDAYSGWSGHDSRWALSGNVELRAKRRSRDCTLAVRSEDYDRAYRRHVGFSMPNIWH